MISTPYLDAAPLSERNREKFETHKLAVEQGLADKKIWNVDYEAAKYWLHSVIESETRRLSDQISNQYRGMDYNDPRWQEYYDNVSHYFNWASAAKVLRGLHKMQNNTPDFESYKALYQDAVTLNEVLKQLKPFVVKGRKPSENPKEVDYTNTGVCPVCMKRQKLDISGNMVAHGFTIRWGGRNGICFGFKHKAWELSPEGAIAFREMLKRILADREEWLRKLKAGEVEKLNHIVRVRKGFGKYEDEIKTVLRGEQGFDRLHENAVYEAERDIRMLNTDIKTLDERIQNWKAEPLKYGGAETQERWKSKLLNKK